MHEFGVPALVEIPASANLTDVVFRRAETEPDVVVLRRRSGAGDWQDVTAAGFGAEVAALARGLVAAGIGPGDRVALMSRTSYEWTLIDYACWAAGAVTVPVYQTSSAEQVEWILTDSSACAVFAETSAHAEIVGSIRGRLPGLARLWMTGELDALASGGARISAEQLEQRRAGRTAADLATIVYTSGTTGRPKGCQITHGNLLADVRNAVAALPEIFEVAGCSTLLFLPLAHVFARIIQAGLELWKKRHGRLADATPRDLADDPELIAEIHRAVDDANKAVSRAESIRRFRVLPVDFTEASGQLTPSLKVRRDVVAKDFAADIEALYSKPSSH